MEKKQKIYLSGPFFNEKERKTIEDIAKILRTEYEVFVPMEHFVDGGENMPNFLWSKEVFSIDVEGIAESDFAVVVDYGFTSDAGTAWEAGYCYAKNKPTHIVSAAEDVKPTHSVMMVHGCTRYFGSFEDLWQFLRGNETAKYYKRGINVK